MNRDRMKQAAAEAALDYIESGMVIGVGTGSTTNLFIDLLAGQRGRIDGAVASSEASAGRLRDAGVRLLQLGDVGELPLYVDGADEATRHLHLVKGGGGAATREKILRAASRRFVCIADESKLVDVLGAFPLPVDVVPLARSLVARRLVALGGQPQLRAGFTTDDGNVVLDVHNLHILDPVAMEGEINNIPGVVTCGLFAREGADVLLLGGAEGVAKLP